MRERLIKFMDVKLVLFLQQEKIHYA